VVGTDPETGNDIVVGVDEDVNLVNTPLPSSIVLVTNPTKMSYNDGESISMTGAVIVAKNADGTTWTSADYPNGIVGGSPDPAAAVYDPSGDTPAGYSSDISDEEKAQYSSYAASVNFPIKSSGYAEWTSRYNHYKFTPDSGCYIFTTSITSSGCTAYICSKNSSTVHVVANGSEEDWPVYSDASFGGKSFKLQRLIQASGQPDFVYNGPPATSGNTSFIAYCILFGTTSETQAGSSQTITLNWARPGDGKVLSTTMEIEVSAASSEYEDDEGGGAGHSF
jgi:hypothetical protein